VSFRSWDGQIWDYLDSTRGLPLNTWSHVALVWSGTTKALYVDGEQIGTRQATLVFDQSDVYLGCELEAGGLATFFGGCIDEPTLYDQALSDEQIAALVLAALSE